MQKLLQLFLCNLLYERTKIQLYAVRTKRTYYINSDTKLDMNTEWSEYLESLSDKYGKVTNLIWISKKRRKYVLEFAYARMLVINDEVYKFKDIISCKVEKVVSFQKDAENASEPSILLIGVNDNTNMLVSVTVWSKSVANEINDLIHEIIKSNKNQTAS